MQALSKRSTKSAAIARPCASGWPSAWRAFTGGAILISHHEFGRHFVGVEAALSQRAADYQQAYAKFMKEKTGMLLGGFRLMAFRHTDGEEAKKDPISPTRFRCLFSSPFRCKISSARR
jgi:hypothetical protein